MKKFVALILCALLLSTAFALTSCDQESVDSMREDILNTSKDLFSPIFKVYESQPDNESEDNEEAEGGSETQTPAGSSTAEGENPDVEE